MHCLSKYFNYFIEVYHGTQGPMVTEESRHTTGLLEAFLEAGQLLGYKVLDDLVKGGIH